MLDTMMLLEDLNGRIGIESSSNYHYIPEDRRREIIAQLKAERQSVAPSPLVSPSRPTEARCRTREERDELIETLLAVRANRSEEENLSQHLHEAYESRSPVVLYDTNKSSIVTEEQESLKSPRSSEAGEGNDTFFYASDILLQSDNANLQPRSHLEIFYPFENDQNNQTIGRFDAMNRRTQDNKRFNSTIGTKSSSLNEHEHHTSATCMVNHHDAPPIMVQEPSNKEQEANISSSERAPTRMGMGSSCFVIAPPPAPSQVNKKKKPLEPSKPRLVAAKTSSAGSGGKNKTTTNTSSLVAHEEEKNNNKKKKNSTPSNRLQYLAQPRNEQFADREKRRLLQEMLQLQECTFKPKLYQEFRPDKGQSSHPHHQQQRISSSSSSPRSVCSSPRQAFGFGGEHTLEWLTLSPRQQKSLQKETQASQVLVELSTTTRGCTKIKTSNPMICSSKLPSKERRSHSLDDQQKGHGNEKQKTKKQLTPSRMRSRRQILERLHLEKPKWLEMRDKAKQEKEEKEIRQHCTFKPKINPMSEYMRTTTTTTNTTNTTSGTIGTISCSHNRPLHERLADLQRAKVS
jgi:hypothetical protein